MAGETPPIEAAAPAEAEAPIEVAAVEVAPVADVAPEPVVEAVAEEPSAEAAPAESAVEAAAEPVVEAAPVEEKPGDPEKPVEAAPEPVAPAYVDFKLPEGLQAAPEQVEAFTGVLGKYGLTQEAGQELMDLHGEALKQAAEAMAQRQQDVFAETQRNWVKEFDKSAGNKRDTVLNDAKWAVTELVKDDKERREVWDVLAFTGAGNNKAVINLLAKAAKRMRERNAPAAGLSQKPAAATPWDARYGNKR